MKKKILLALCLVTMSLGLIACGKKVAEGEDSGESSALISETAVSSEEKTDKESAEKESDDSASEETEISGNLETDKESKEATWLYSSFYNSIYKTEGEEILETVALSDLTSNGCYFGIRDRKVVFYKYGEGEEEGTYGNIFFDVDIDTLESRELAFCSQDYHYADINDGKLVIVTREDNKYYDRIIDLDTLVETDSDASYPIEGESAFYENYNILDYVHIQSAGKVLEENGAVLWTVDKEQIYIDPSGQKNYGNVIGDGTVQAYRKNKVVVTKTESDTYIRDLFVYDLETGDESLVCKDLYEFNGVMNDCIYYTVIEKEELRNSLYSVKSYNLFTGENKDLYSCQEHHGMDNYIPGSNMQLENGNIYYLYDDGRETSWYLYSVDKGQSCAVSQPVKTYPFLELGEISYTFEGIECDDCGEIPGQFCYETLVIDKNKIPGADKINSYFEEKMEESIRQFKDEADYLLSDLFCEDHKQYYGHYTVENDVADAFLLGDNYLVVNLEGSYYMGGAHGMPTKNSILFDCQTGETVDFFSLYKGSFEDFRTFAAGKTKEDFEKYPEERSPYFANDGESVYIEAYESIYEESLPIIWGRDGLIISYSPYIMGAYASGFIEINVPYEEVGITFE